MLHISDTSGQTAHIREEYIIAVIVPSVLGGGDGKCRIVFVGGIIEVTREEAQRVVDHCHAHVSQEAGLRASAAAAH